VLDDIADGDVVVCGPDPMPFLVAERKRRPFLSPEEFFAAGYDPEQVKVLVDPKSAHPAGESTRQKPGHLARANLGLARREVALELNGLYGDFRGRA
jgi:hypothetical protein